MVKRKTQKNPEMWVADYGTHLGLGYSTKRHAQQAAAGLELRVLRFTKHNSAAASALKEAQRLIGSLEHAPGSAGEFFVVPRENAQRLFRALERTKKGTK